MGRAADEHGSSSSLAFLAYNLRRVMNILGVEEMKQRLSSI